MKFHDVIASDNIIGRLRRMVDSDQMPHALLLHGAPGVPKLALARALAQYLHCTHRTNGEPCGECPSCRQHQSFNHADTFFSYPIVKAHENPTSNDFFEEWKEFLNNSPIENFQKWVGYLNKDNAQPIIYQSESERIIHDMSLAAFTAKYKVLIMWLPEKMHEACANKLLKMIEEPAMDTKIILVSNDAAAILPTIFSRCQRIELKKPSTAQVANYLAERYNLDQATAQALAIPADGNVAQAEQNMQLDSEDKQFHEDFKVLMRMAYARNIKGLKQWSEQVAEYKREKTRRFLTYAARMVRENFIFNLHHPALNYETPEEQLFSTRFAPYINENNVEQMIAEFNRAEKDILMNGNGKIVLFDMTIKMAILIKP